MFPIGITRIEDIPVCLNVVLLCLLLFYFNQIVSAEIYYPLELVTMADDIEDLLREIEEKFLPNQHNDKATDTSTKQNGSSNSYVSYGAASAPVKNTGRVGDVIGRHHSSDLV